MGFTHSFVASLSLLSLSLAARTYPRPNVASCKNVPGTDGWPSREAWGELMTATKGRLIEPWPAAAPCHRSNVEVYSAEACSAVTRGFRDSSWHANHPTSNMWQNYNNYSCMPDGAGACTTTGFPLFVVEAVEPSDVKAAVDFALKYNIRLNVKSTGHDFLGRSVQPYSLSIWTHKMTTQQWHQGGFKPKGCDITIPGTSVTVGAGSRWGTLGAAARSRGVMLVGGAFSSVSVGGYLSNGGHGSLSAKYGLGADMVAEIQLVTPQGEIITANECQNQDYFWAMRGGGGSTYGVATHFTIQAIPTVRISRYASRVSGWDEITALHRQWGKLAMIGGAGYFNGYPGRGGGVTWSVAVPNVTQAELRSVLDPVLSAMGRDSSGGGFFEGAASQVEEEEDEEERKLRKNKKSRRRRSTSKKFIPITQRGTYQEWDTYGEAQAFLAPHADEEKLMKRAGFPGMGQNKIISSWLYSHEDNQHPNLKQALMGAFDGPTQMLNDATMGVGTHNPPYMRGGGNAVNPAFRTAVMRPASELQWSGTDAATLAKKWADAAKFTESYRSISKTTGTYANEAFADTRDWQHAFWGSNYEKLLEIKMRVDPYGVLYCRSCVGSEYWFDNYGQLCIKEDGPGSK